MTREEATTLLKSRVDLIKSNYPEIDDYCEALEMAIEALKQESCKGWRFYYRHGYEQAKKDLLCDDCILRADALSDEGDGKIKETNHQQMGTNVPTQKTVPPMPTAKLEQKPIVDKIRTEIADIYCGQYCENPLTADAVREMALEIVDKYKTGSEG